MPNFYHILIQNQKNNKKVQKIKNTPILFFQTTIKSFI